MTDIEQALAEAYTKHCRDIETMSGVMHICGFDDKECAADILAAEPMQAIARVVEAAVAWDGATRSWISPDGNGACQQAAWELRAAVAAMLGDDDD